MPEGDTIYKLARVLDGELSAEALDGVWLRDTGELAFLEGAHVSRVFSLGKHLLVDIDGQYLLRSHLGMGGDIHRYTRGETWRKPRLAAVAVVSSSDREFVWLEPAEVELFPAAELRRHRRLSRLGPDLLGETFDAQAVVERARRKGAGRSIAEVLLDQTVAAGIGNIYKSEVLFVAGVSPFRGIGDIADMELAGLYLAARELMHTNLGPGRRTTRLGSGPRKSFLPGEPRLWVYGRAGHLCLVCGNAIRSTSQGDQARATYYCPSCQG